MAKQQLSEVAPDTIRKYVFDAKSRSFILFVVVVGIGFAIKCYLLFLSDFGSNLLTTDEYSYLDYANSLKENFTYESPDGRAYRPPFFSFTLMLVKLTLGNKIVYYKIFNILLSLATIILVWKSLPEKTRLTGALFFMCYPSFFFIFELVLAENLALLLMAVLLYAYKRHNANSSVWPLATMGVVAGLLSLTRPESVIYLSIVFFYLVYRNRRMIWPVVIWFAFLQGWLIRNYFVVERYPIVSTNAAHTFYLATFPESTGTSIYSIDDPIRFPTFVRDLKFAAHLTEMEKYDFYLSRGRHYLIQNPGTFFELLPARILAVLLPESTVAEKLVNSGRLHLPAGYFQMFVALSILWDIFLWTMLVYALAYRQFDLAYLGFLLGIIVLACIVIGEARYRIQIIPPLVIGIFSAMHSDSSIKHTE